MKVLRKTLGGLFICEECGITCIKSDNLSRHIGLKHNKEEYFKKYLIEIRDEFCSICGGKITLKITFSNFNRPSFCSKKCQNKDLSQKKNDYSEIKKKNIEKKRKKTCLKKYGENNPVKVQIVRDKIEKTCFKKYGETNYFKSNEFKTNLDNRMNSIHNKKRFRNTEIHYQSSYELDFLEKYFDNIDIKNGPTIFYKFKGKEKRYYSDFFIPSLNLVVEIKSSYIYRKTLGENIQKKKYAENHGYKFIFLIDKKYQKLEKYYVQ
jgi:hypothetical protein